jgi:hypothetical protein
VPPKSKEFQQLVREILSPSLAALGFTRPRDVGFGGWRRPEGPGWLIVWTQLSRGNYGDASEGYKFIVELQLGAATHAGSGDPRARLYELLTDDQRADVLRVHNEVIVKTRPDPAMLGLLKPAWVRADYLASFQRRSTPFPSMDDVWFRYTDVDDVRRWLGFIASVLPEAIDRFVASVEVKSQEHAKRG